MAHIIKVARSKPKQKYLHRGDQVKMTNKMNKMTWADCLSSNKEPNTIYLTILQQVTKCSLAVKKGGGGGET